jgi:phospholipid-binding lipoprotein MlaA
MNKNTLTRTLALTTAVVGLAGCATVKNPDPRDPWESFNRGVYTFNDKVDRAVLRPIAVGYTKVVPQPAQSCIHNMFNNVADIWAAANSMLQGRGRDAINTFGRFLFNTTMGVAGCFDVATANGANRIPNDFGTTLGVWGIGQGPYVVLPFWGSSTIRDTAGLAGDFVGNQWTSVGAVDNVPLRNSLYGLWVVDRRASLLDATDTVDRIALDPYSFVRDAYLQRRAAMVLGRKAGEAGNLPNYEDEGEDNGDVSKPAAPGGAATQPAGPGIGGAGGTPAPARK